jgi:hypothetical protein
MKRITESIIITLFNDCLQAIPPFACLRITKSTKSNSFCFPALRKQASAPHRLKLNYTLIITTILRRFLATILISFDPRPRCGEFASRLYREIHRSVHQLIDLGLAQGTIIQENLVNNALEVYIAGNSALRAY